ncbi:MAG: HDOD domain-containing protein [Candidatus Kapaibacterium sp.]
MSIIESLVQTQEFATLPPVATKVLNMLENDDLDVRDIAEVIEKDASLTLKLLRVANSPLYATRGEITSIQQAIMNLGLNRLTNIVLGVSIFSKFLLSSQKEARQLMEKFWWHASCTGMVAKSLSDKLGVYFRESEFIGGLLHDIGKLAMLQYDSSRYGRVVEMVQNHGAIDLEAEHDVFGATHTEVGAEIARLWKLPEDLTTVIVYHMQPSLAPAHKPLTAVVRLSALLCEVWGAGFFEGVKKLDLKQDESWIVLTRELDDVKNMDVEILTFELEKDFQKSSEFLKIISTEK